MMMMMIRMTIMMTMDEDEGKSIEEFKVTFPSSASMLHGDLDDEGDDDADDDADLDIGSWMIQYRWMRN